MELLVWLLSVCLASTVRCYPESEFLEDIRLDLIQTLKHVDVFLKREENNALRKLRQIHRWRLFHRNMEYLNRSIVNPDLLEYNKQLGIVCPKNMNLARKHQYRFMVESYSNVNFEVILNTLQRLQAFVNMTLQSTIGRRTQTPMMHPLFDQPQFRKDIIENKKIDLLKYVDGRWQPKQTTIRAYRSVSKTGAMRRDTAWQRNRTWRSPGGTVRTLRTDPLSNLGQSSMVRTRDGVVTT